MVCPGFRDWSGLEKSSADLLVEFNEAEAAEAAPTFELGGRAIHYIGKAALIRNKKTAGLVWTSLMSRAAESQA